MNLYFENSQGKYHLIDNNVNDKNVIEKIKNYIHTKNSNFQIYYIRSWMNSKGKCFDVGSHTEFFYMTDQKLDK